MRCTVKAITLIRPYVKSDGSKSLGGFSYTVQDFPMSQTITVFSRLKLEEGDSIFITPIRKMDGSVYYRVMEPDEIQLEIQEIKK
ncbi:MAG: hypothetical protein RLZZ102_399 [Pseudomonadota bacterium]|jgi:hypothetical protein